MMKLRAALLLLAVHAFEQRQSLSTYTAVKALHQAVRARLRRRGDDDEENPIFDLSDIASVAVQEPSPVLQPPTTSVILSENVSQNVSQNVSSQNFSQNSSAVSLELSGLEHSVLALSNETPSAAMLSFVGEVRQMLENRIMQGIRQTFNQSNTSLQEAVRDMRSCLVNHSQDNYGISPDEYNLTYLQQKHRYCRQNQSEAEMNVTITKNLADAKKAVMEAVCQEYHEHNRSTVGCADDCAWRESDTHNPNKYIDYFRQQFELWDRRWKDAVLVRERCEHARNESQEADANATNASDHHDDLKSNCSEIQAEMDSSSCNYKDALDQACTDSRCCVDNNWETIDRILYGSAGCCDDASRFLEISLQEQMRASLRIICYLDAFSSQNMSVQIQVCQGLDFRADDNVTALDFGYHGLTKPTLSEVCQYDKCHIAGYCKYESNYYDATYGLTEPCKGSCCLGLSHCKEG